jgi:O-antigen/teichoic acid export membrane protein
MHLRRAMLSSTLQQSATLLLSFAIGIVIAHLLTPRQAGSYSVAIASINSVTALKDTALGSYVVSAPAPDQQMLRSAFGLNLAIAACLTLGFLWLSFPLADFYQDPALGQNLRIIAFAQLGPAIAFPATVCLMREMRFGSLLAIGLTAMIFQCMVSITLAALGYGALALGWGYFASAMVTATMTIACEPNAARLRPALKGSRDLLAFGGWSSATLLVGSTAMSVPELVIGRVLGLADAALFSRAQNLVSVVRNSLFIGITRPLLPSLGERESKSTNLAPLYQRLVEAITGLSWPAYAVLAIWAEPLVGTIYGEAWSAAGTMMMPIALAHALTLTVAPHYDILIVKRRQRLLFASELAVFIFTITALAIGLTVGIGGALWSLVLSSAFFASCNFIVIKSVIEFSPSALFKAWSRSLTLTLVAIPVPLAIRHLITGAPLEIMLGFFGSIAISALIWISTVMLIRHELSLHINGLMKRISLPPRMAASPAWWPHPKESDRR